MNDLDLLKSRLKNRISDMFDDLFDMITGEKTGEKIDYYEAKGILALIYELHPSEDIKQTILAEDPTATVESLIATHKAKFLGMTALLNKLEGTVKKCENLIDSMNNEAQEQDIKNQIDEAEESITSTILEALK